MALNPPRDQRTYRKKTDKENDTILQREEGSEPPSVIRWGAGVRDPAAPDAGVCTKQCCGTVPLHSSKKELTSLALTVGMGLLKTHKVRIPPHYGHCHLKG